MRIRALLLLAIAAGIHAGPIAFEESTCSTTCVPTLKFGYEQGRTYRYEYEADTVTSVAGASEEHSALHIWTTVDIYVQSPCELILKLGDSRLEETSPTDLTRRQVSQNSDEFRAALERSALRFSFQDGRVESICALEEEPEWVNNFKRGVLSAFQNSMENFDNDATVSETDITGNCEADYKISTSGFSSTTLTKSKNLLGCTERTGYFSSLQATTYRVPSKIQSLPLLKSTHECQQTISSSGILQRSDCHETHMFRPFSNGDSGALTTVKQVLTLKDEVRQSAPRTGQFTQRSSLLYKHEPRDMGKRNDQTEVLLILREICQSRDISPETPKLFSNLVYAMRQLDVYTLKKVYNMVKSGRVCPENKLQTKKFFEDAIPATGSPASVALIRELTRSGEVVGPEVDVWITSLAFIQEPNAEIIKEAKEMITNEIKPRAYLAVSSLVNTFCKTTNCEGNNDVQEIIRALTQNLGYNCKVSPQDEEKVLLTLKALGNAGINSNTLTTLARCAASEDVSTEIRVAAIQAFRRLPCKEDRESLMTLLMNTNEDSELRINAYIEVMRCPSEVIITQVKHVLENEEVNQVGSFIWTHLTNLMETNDPLKQDIRAITEDEKLAKEFNLDVRKFSRNYEGSLFWESLNAGAGYESNLIWSPESFLPRSAMLNLTVDIFGKSMNLMEIGGRMEGVEKYLEKFFGPQGYFPQSMVSDLIKGKMESIDSALHEKMMQSDPKASVYMKMFGNELRHIDLTGMEDNLKDFNILDILIKLAQNHEVDITRSTHFIDAEMTVPTTLGLPLKLSINGTATIDIKIGGKMDVRKAATSPHSFDIDGYVKPSGAVTLASAMGIDAFMARTGVKLVNTLHSSTELNGKVTLEDSQIISAKFNMPQEKVEILNVERKFYIIHREEERQQEMLTDNVIDQSMCTGDLFAKVTGVKVCGEMKFPLTNKETAPHFPIAAPVKASLSLEKADTHTSYQFEARVETKKERRDGALALTHIAHISFDTPGSQVDRRFLAEYNIDRMAKTLKVNLRSPWKESTVDGSITNTDNLKNANIQMTVDGKWKYSAVAEVDTSMKGQTYIVIPNFSISAPGMNTISLTGKNKFTPNEKIDLDITLKNVFSEPVTLTGGIDRTAPNRFTTDVNFMSPLLSTQVSGFIVKKQGLFSTRTEFKYSYGSGQQHQFVLNGKFKDTSNNYASKYSINTAITSTEYPDYNMQMESDFILNKKQMVSSIEFLYGDNPKDNYKKIIFKQNADIEGSWKKAVSVDYSLKAMWKAKGINVNGKISHTHDESKEIKTQGSLSYAPGKEISIDINSKKESMSSLSMSHMHDLKLSIPGRDMRLYATINEKQPKQYSHEMIVQWQQGKQIRTLTDYSIDKHTHQLRSQIYRPSGAMSVLSGEIVADPEDFKTKMDLEHEGQTYSTSVEYTYLFKPNKKQIGGKFDLVIPQRHVIVESEVSAIQKTYAASMSTMWDADRDSSKKVDVSGRLELTPINHEGQVKVIYPGRKITATLNQVLSKGEFTHHSELSWEARKTIIVDASGKLSGNAVNGNIKVATPFFNEISLTGNGEKKREEMTGHLEVNYGEVISTDVSLKMIDGWKNMDSSITVNTPFRGYEKLSVVTKHNVSPGLKEVHVEVMKNSDKVEVTKKLESGNGKHEGLAEVIYPGRKVTLNYNCHKTGNAFKHHSDLSWSDKAKPVVIDIVSDMKPSSVQGSFKISTPFTANDVILNVNGQKSREGLEGHVEIDYGSKISTDVSMKSSDDYKTMENSILIHTPFRSIERLRLTTSHSLEGPEKNIHIEIEKNSDKIELDASGKFRRDSMEAEIKVDTPFSYPISVKTSGTLSPTKADGIFQVEWQKKRVEMELESKYEHNKVEGKFEVKTPYTEPITVKVDASLENKEVSAKFEVECQDKMLEIELSGKREGQSGEGHLEIKTPFTEPVIVSGSATVRNGEIVSHVELEGQRKKIELDVNGKYQAQIIEGGLELKTPFFLPVAIHSSTTFNSKEGKSTLEIEWEGKKIEIEASGKNVFEISARDLEAILSIKTPYTEDILIEGKHQDDGREFRSNMIAKWSPRQQITIELVMNHNINDINLKNDGKLTVATPFSKLRNVVINWNQDFQGMESLTSRNEVVYNQKTIRLNVDHSFKKNSNMQKLNTKASIETPFSVVRSMNAEVDYVFNRRMLMGSASLKHDNVNYFTLTTDTSVLEDDVSSKTQLKSKIPYAEDLSLNYNFKYEGMPRTEVVEFKWAPSMVITVNNEFLRKGEGFSGSLKLTTPFRHVERIIMSYDHDKIDGEWKSMGSLEYAPNKVVKIETGLSMEHELSASLDVSAPCQYFRKFSTSFSQSGYGTSINHKSAVHFEMDKGFINYDGEISVHGLERITGNVKFSSPFRYIRNHELNIDHSLEGHEYISKVSYQFNRKNINVETQFQNNNGHFKINADVSSTFSNAKSLQFGVEHHSTDSGLTGKVTMNSRIMEQPISFTVSYGMEETRKVTGDLQLKTPFSGFENLAGKLDLTILEKAFNILIEVALEPRNVITFNTDFSMVDGVKLSSSVQTPFKEMSLISVSVDHTNSVPLWRGLDSSAKFIVHLEDGEIELAGGVKLNDFELMNAELSLKTPYANAEKLAIRLNHEFTESRDNQRMNINQEFLAEYLDKKIQLTKVITGEKVDKKEHYIWKTVFTSPFTGFEKIELTQSFDVEYYSLSLYNMALNYAPGKTIDFEGTYNKDEGKKYTVTINTPFETMSHLSCEGHFRDRLKELTSNFKGELTVNGVKRQIGGSTSLTKTRTKLEGKITLTNLEDHVGLMIDIGNVKEISVSGSIEEESKHRLSIKGNVNAGRKQYNANGYFQYDHEEGHSGEVSLTGRATNMKFSYSHKGRLNDFEQKMTFINGDDTTTYEGKYSPIDGNFKITSPYKLIKLLQLEFGFRGEATDFNANGAVTYGPNKKVESQVSFKLSSGMQASFTASGPFFKDISITVNHDGTTQFTHITTASYGKRTVQLECDFKTDPNIEGSLKITTPFYKAKTIQAGFKHVDQWKKFKTQVNFNHNDKNTFSGEINFDWRKAVVGNVVIDSSFGRMFSIDFDHNTNLPESMNTRGSVTIGSSKIGLDTAFTMHPAEGHFKLETPWSAVRDIDATFKHTGPIDNFETTAKVMYNKGNPIEAKVKFTSGKLMKGSFEVSTPFESIRSVSGDFSHKFTRQVLQCHGNMNANGKIIKGDVDFKLTPIDGNVRLQTPFQHMEDITVTLTNQGQLPAFDTVLKMEHNEFGNVQVSGKLDVDPIKGFLRIETPSEYMTNAEVRFNHDGSLTRFTNSLEIEHNKIGKIKYNGKLNVDSGIVAEFTLETPYSTMKETSLKINHVGGIKEFTSHIEISHNKLGKVTIDGNFKPWTGKFNVQSPCTYFRDITVEFTHNDGKTNTQVNYNGKVWKVMSDIQMKPLSADISFEIPTGKSFGLQLNHNGRMRNFQTKVSVLIDGKEAATARVKLDTRSGVASQLFFSSPMTSEVAIVYNHDGDINQFTCNGNLKVNRKQVVNGELKFNLMPLEVSLELQTPYSSMRNMKAAVAHSGNIRAFKTNIDLKHNSAQYHGDVEFKMTSDSINLDISTPFSSLRSIQLSGTHSGELSDFRTTVAATVNEAKSYNLDVAYKMTTSGVMLDLKTSYPIMKHLEFAATYSGNQENFRTNVELTHNDGEKYALGVAFKITPTEVNLDLQTPLTWLRNLEISATHTGSINNFRSTADISHNNGRKYHIDVAFSFLETEFSAEVNTPVSWMKHVVLSGTFEGTIENCKTSVTFSHNNGRAYQVELAYKITPTEVTIDLKTPLKWMQHLEVAATFIGTVENFESSIQVSHNDGEKYQGQINYKHTPTEIKVDLKTPISWLRQLDVAATFEGTMENFMTKIEASHNDGKRYEINAAVRMSTNEINLELQTPISWMRQLELAATCTGNIKNFKSNIEVNHNNGGKYKADITFNLEDGELKLDLETPHRDMRKMELIATHTGNMRNFRTNVEVTHNNDRKYYADASFKQYPTTEGKINVQTPWKHLREASLTFNHDGDRSAFKSSGELIHNGDKLGRADVDFRSNPISGTVKVVTPIRGAEETTLTFSHSGDSNSFQQHADLALFGKKYTMDATYSKNPMEIQLTITTPHAPYERLEFIYNHKGNLRTTYTGHAEVTYKAGKKVELDVEFKFYRRLNIAVNVKTPFRNVDLTLKHENNNGIIKSLAQINTGRGKSMKASLDLTLGTNANGILEITTPFRGFEEITAQFEQQISGNLMTSSGSMNYNGRQINCTANGQFDGLTNMVGKVEMRTPFRNAEYFMLSGKTEGDIRNLIAELDIVLPKEYTVKGTFTLDTTQGVKADLKTNIKMIEDVVLHINHVSNSRKLKTEGELTYGSNRIMSFGVDFTNGVQSFDGVIRFTSPVKHMENLFAEVHHEGDLSNFKSSALASWEDGKEVKLSGEYKSVNGIPTTSTVKLTAPFMRPVSMDFNNVINDEMFEATTLIGWGSDQAINMRLHGLASGSWSNLNLKANAEVTTPFRRFNHMSFDAQHQHSYGIVDSSVTCKHNRRNMIDSKVNLNSNTGVIRIDGPLRVNMNYDRNDNGGSMTMDNPFAVNGRYTINDGEIIIDVAQPIRVDAKVNYTPRGGVFTMESPFKANARIQYSRNGGSFTMQDPIKVDARANFDSNGGTVTMTEPFKVDAKVQYDNNGGVVTMTEPFKVDAKVQYDNNGGVVTMTEPFKVDAKVQYDNNGGVVTMTSPFEVDASYTLKNNAEGSISVRKPFIIEASGSYIKDQGSFSMQEPIEIETSYSLIENGASFEMVKPYPVDATFRLTKNSGSFVMQNPYPVDVSYTITKNGGSFNMDKPYPVDASLKYNRNGGSFRMLNPYPITASLKIEEDGASFNMETPYNIDASYNYNRNGGSVKIECQQSPYSIDVGYTMKRDGISVNMKAPFEVDGSYKINENTGSVQMSKPYPVEASYNIGWNSGSVIMQQPYPLDAKYTLNKNAGSITIDKPVAFDMSYTYNGKQGSVVMNKPRQMSAEYKIKGESCRDISGSFGVNWNTNRQDSNAKVEFMHKDESTQNLLKKDASLRTILPTRITSISGSIERSASRIMQTTEVTWNEAKNKKICYLIDMNDRSSYYQTKYDLTAKLNTPLRNMEAIMSHSDNKQKYTSEATLKWDSTRDQNKAFTLKNEYEMNGPTHKSEMTISSPLMNRDIALRNEFTINSGNVLYTCRHELQYSDDSRDTLLLTTRFAEDGNRPRGNHNFTGAFKLVHPKSTIDVQVDSFMAITDILAATGLKVNYMTVDREMKIASVRAEINKVRKAMNVELDTPVKKAEMRAFMTKEDVLYTYNMIAQDESSQVSGDITINHAESSFDIEAHPNPRNPSETITFKGNYLSPTSLKVQALHTSGNRQQVEDSVISINMEDSHLLRTRVHWRPALFDDVKSTVSSFIENTDVTPTLREIRQFRRAVVSELQGKRLAIINSIPSFTPIREFLTAESDSFASDFKAMKKELNRMYWKNEFFMKDIDHAIEKTTAVLYKAVAVAIEHISVMTNKLAKVINAVYSSVSSVVDNLIQVAEAIIAEYLPVIIEKCTEICENFVYPITHQIWEMYSMLKETLGDIIYACFDILGDIIMSLKPYVEAYIRLFNHVSKWLQETCDKVQQKYNAVMATYPLNKLGPWYNTAKSTVGKYSKQVSKLNLMGPIYDAHISLSGKINDMAEKMAKHADSVSDKYAAIIYTVHAAVGRNMDNYIHRPASEYVREWLTEFRDKAKWAYEILGLEDMVKNFMENTMDWAINLFKSNALYLTEKYLHLDLTKIVAYDPREGDFDFQIYIPDEMPSFQHVPFTDIEWSELGDRLRHIRDNMNVAVPDEFNPWDYYYQYKPSSLNPLDWIPPFKAIATVTGQHVTAFDGTHYEFFGTCSYVLARDVIDGQFTIVKDYDKDIFRIFVDNKQIDVAMTGQVTIDGIATEIPTTLETTTITREGDVIAISSKRAFNVLIDTHNELFALEISGWYYNKLAGLLGTYDNEHYDDLTMSNGERTEDINRFTESWQVGLCQDHTNRAVEHFIDESKPSAKVCKFLFECPMSPLKNCFKVVSPKKYLSECVNDVEESGDDKGGVCKAAAAYAMVCKQKGITVKVPKPCRKCQDEVQRTNPQSADVIFVIEQKKCNNDMVSKIDNLAIMTDKALNTQGLGGNKFGLIGFGGEGVHDLPHVHTIGGKLMGTSREIKPAAESLVFVEDGENVDAIGALKFATQYPFRAGVAKAVVLITCGPCSDSDTSLDEVKEEMKAAGIQLHVMVEHEFATNTGEASPKTSYLYGIDSESAYTKSDVRDKELNGDQELHKQIAKPDNNKCAQLALDTKGSFFNLQKLKEGRVRFQKHFMDVFSRRVAKTSQSDECSVCECNEEGIKVCRPCENTLLGHPDEEPAQFYDHEFEQDFQQYLGSL